MSSWAVETFVGSSNRLSKPESLEDTDRKIEMNRKRKNEAA